MILRILFFIFGLFGLKLNDYSTYFRKLFFTFQENYDFIDRIESEGEYCPIQFHHYVEQFNSILRDFKTFQSNHSISEEFKAVDEYAKLSIDRINDAIEQMQHIRTDPDGVQKIPTELFDEFISSIKELEQSATFMNMVMEKYS